MPAALTADGTRYVERKLEYSAKRTTLERDARVFNSLFEPGMTLRVSGQDVILCLRSVKMSTLNSFKRQLESELAAQITAAVESVKSYGYSNGVKQFVGYDAERKTKDRARKSRARLGEREPGPAAGGARDTPREDARELVQEDNEMPAEFQNKMICGDSLKVLEKIPDNSVDMVLTSPPYNFGLDYSGGDDARLWEKYFEKLFEILDECVRVLKYGGRLLINVQPLFSDYIPTHHKISEHIAQQPGMLWKGEILWEKNNYNCKYTAWGSWKSPSSPYLKYTWEFIEVFCKGTLKKEGDKADADISGDDFKKWVYAKWSIAPEKGMKQYGHPAMFPEELAKRALQLFSFKNDLVLDPFMGVGTACCVARRLGRRYLGIDISEQYVRRAEGRMQSQL